MSHDKIPKERLNQLKKAFDIFDINNDGDITLQVIFQGIIIMRSNEK